MNNGDEIDRRESSIRIRRREWKGVRRLEFMKGVTIYHLLTIVSLSLLYKTSYTRRGLTSSQTSRNPYRRVSVRSLFKLLEL